MGFLGQALPFAQIAEAFDVQPNCSDAGIIQHVHGDISLGGLGLVSTSHHLPYGQPAHLHGQVDQNVGRLRQDRDTTIHGLQSMLVRPDARLIQCIEEAIAVRSQNGHLARRFHQLCL